VDWGIDSYLGVPLRDAQGKHLGHLAVFDERPMPAEPRNLFTFRIFATRAAAELERLQYEERLRESEQRSRSLTEELRQVNARLELAMHASNIGIWEYDMPDGRIENSQQTFINVWEPLGYDPREAPTDFASGFTLAIHPDDQERLRRDVQEFLVSQRREFETEYRVRSKDGSECWRLARGVALRDPEGRPVRFVGTFVEITDRKRAEEALRKSEEELRRVNDRLELAVRGSNLAIWEYDMPDGKIENAHPTFINVSESLGYDATASPTGYASVLSLFVHPDDHERLWREVQEFLVSDRRVFETEARVRHKDGSDRGDLKRGGGLGDPGGKFVRFVGRRGHVTGLDRVAHARRDS